MIYKPKSSAKYVSIPSEVEDKLGYYVYRLVDPRNGATFYVGKGIGSRVLAHINEANACIDLDSDSEKEKRIHEIHDNGLEVDIFIHRHGLDEPTAFEVEAALIEAYPNLTNIAGGHHSSERGLKTLQEIKIQYAADPLVAQHNIVTININKSIELTNSIYDAVRFAWVASKPNCEKCEYVIALLRGIVVGVFKADEWKVATLANFPEFGEPDQLKRIGFVGKEAPKEIVDLYMNKKLLTEKKGSQNPIKYLWL